MPHRDAETAGWHPLRDAKQGHAMPTSENASHVKIALVVLLILWGIWFAFGIEFNVTTTIIFVWLATLATIAVIKTRKRR